MKTIRINNGLSVSFVCLVFAVLLASWPASAESFEPMAYETRPAHPVALDPMAEHIPQGVGVGYAVGVGAFGERAGALVQQYVNTSDRSVHIEIPLLEQLVGHPIRVLATFDSKSLSAQGALARDYADLGAPWIMSYSDELVSLDPAPSGAPRLALLSGEGDTLTFVEVAPGIFDPESVGQTSRRLQKVGLDAFEEARSNSTYHYVRLDPDEDRWSLDRIERSDGGFLSVQRMNGLIVGLSNDAGVTVDLIRPEFNGNPGAFQPLKVHDLTASNGPAASVGYDATHAFELNVAAGHSYQASYAAQDDRLLTLTEDGDTAIGITYADEVAASGIETRHGTTRFFDKLNPTRTDILDPVGNTWSVRYDDFGRTVAFVDPLGNELSRAFDSDGNVASVVDALGNSWAYEYDGGGRLVGEIDPTHRYARWNYDSQGNLTSFVAPSGATTTYTYDAQGRLVSETDPTGVVQTVEYGADGRPSSLGYANGPRLALGYDAEGRINSYTDAAGIRIDVARDFANRPIEVEIEPLAGMRRAFSTFGERIQVETLTGFLAVHQVDARGRPTLESDLAGVEFTRMYDSANRITSVTDELNRTRSYAYDASGRLVSMTDPAGYVTAYGYDPRGLLSTVTDPLGRVTSYAYDANRNVVQKSFPNGRTIVFTYDASQRVIGKAFPDATSESYVYDRDGNMTTLTGPSGSIKYGYDAAGRVISSRHVDATGRTWSVGFTYNEFGQRSEMILHNGDIVTYAYDAAGRPSSLTTPVGSRTFDYEPIRGRLSRVVDPGGEELLFEYDLEGRVIGREQRDDQGALVHEVILTLDQAGRPLTMNDSDSGMTRYVYDAAGQVMFMILPDGKKVTLLYDLRGLRTHYLSAATTASYFYDAAGQLTSITKGIGEVVTFAYADANRDDIQRVIDRTSSLSGTRSTEISYQGWRRAVTKASGERYEYSYYPGRFPLVSTVGFSKPGATPFDYGLAYDGFSPLAQISADGVAPEINYSGIGETRRNLWPAGSDTSFSARSALAQFSRSIAGGMTASSTLDWSSAPRVSKLIHVYSQYTELRKKSGFPSVGTVGLPPIGSNVPSASVYASDEYSGRRLLARNSDSSAFGPPAQDSLFARAPEQIGTGSGGNPSLGMHWESSCTTFEQNSSDEFFECSGFTLACENPVCQHFTDPACWENTEITCGGSSGGGAFVRPEEPDETCTGWSIYTPNTSGFVGEQWEFRIQNADEETCEGQVSWSGGPSSETLGVEGTYTASWSTPGLKEVTATYSGDEDRLSVLVQALPCTFSTNVSPSPAQVGQTVQVQPTGDCDYWTVSIQQITSCPESGTVNAQNPVFETQLLRDGPATVNVTGYLPGGTAPRLQPNLLEVECAPITLSPTTVETNQEVCFSVNPALEDAQVSWSAIGSDDFFDSGDTHCVKYILPGTYPVYAAISGNIEGCGLASCDSSTNVTIAPSSAQVSILGDNPLYLGVDQEKTVTASGTPPGGTYSWNVTDASVVEIVSSQSESVTLRGVSEGDTALQITYTVNGSTATDSIGIDVFRVDIDGDANHDATIEDGDADDSVEHDDPGVIMLNNVDDDDYDEIPDNLDAVINNGLGQDTDDLAPIMIRKIRNLPPSWTVKLSLHSPENHDPLTGADDVTRIFAGALSSNPEEILGPGKSSMTLDITSQHGLDKTNLANTDIVIHAEGLQFAAKVRLKIELLDASSTPVGSDELLLKVSPLIFIGHTNDATRTFACDTNNSGPFVTAFRAASPLPASEDVVIPPYLSQSDPWAQDQFQNGFQEAPYGRWRVVLDSKRVGGLSNFPSWGTEEVHPGLLGPDHGYIKISNGVGANDLDSFGNLEVTPPFPNYPFGRIYYGGATCNVLGVFDSELSAFLNRQIQAPKSLNTCWLRIGHVDEIMTIVPDGSVARGWRVLFASPKLALDLLGQVPGDMHIPQYEEDPDQIATPATVAKLLASQQAAGMSLEDHQVAMDAFLYGPASAGRMGGLKGEVKTAFGLDESDIIEVPVLFGSYLSTNFSVAVTPNVVNSAVINGEFIAAKQFLTSEKSPVSMYPGLEEDTDGDSTQDTDNGDNLFQTLRDPFELYMTDMFSAEFPSMGIHFIDDWVPFHVGYGEVHCGTNEMRQLPVAKWWDF